MIISASRRTDIPSYYSEWFYNRIKEEYVLVRNPMNIHQVGEISLSPAVVDGIVFWTKNPIPLMERLSELDKYNYYFQFTLTAYGRDVEPNIPSKNQMLIPAFTELSKRIGKDRIIWRYDPIFLNAVYTIEYHLKYFKVLAAKLAPYTEKCTVSFLDLYKNTMRNVQPFQIRIPAAEEQNELMCKFSEIAKLYGIYVDTCAEEGDFSQYGIGHAHCIDKERFEHIGHYKLDIKKDTNQRGICGCVSSIDIGTYNTCKNGCVYCYANYSKNTVMNQTKFHDPNSPLLFGTLGEDDVIKERKMVSYASSQMSIFDIK